MPESAEVRRLVDDLKPVVNSVITDTKVLSGRYTRKPIAGFDKLVGFEVLGITCKGKLIIVRLNRRGFVSVELNLLLTLGMTGWWHLSDKDIIIQSRGTSLYEGGFRHQHARLRINLGTHSLIFTDPRNFGTVKVVSGAGLKQKLNELGPDVAEGTEMPDEAIRRYERYGRKKTVAELLLDQRVFCGVGNYMRADALYMAQIDPRTPALELPKQQRGNLWHWCSVVANAAYQDLSIGNKLHSRYVSPCYGRPSDDFGNPIERYEDRNGRTVWWCPTIQVP